MHPGPARPAPSAATIAARRAPCRGQRGASIRTTAEPSSRLRCIASGEGPSEQRPNRSTNSPSHRSLQARTKHCGPWHRRRPWGLLPHPMGSTPPMGGRRRRPRVVDAHAMTTPQPLGSPPPPQPMISPMRLPSPMRSLQLSVSPAHCIAATDAIVGCPRAPARWDRP